MTPIVLENISKAYGGVGVLERISLTLPSGPTCLMGPSGIGKTTLAYIVAGLTAPDSGTMTGRENKKISLVFQEDRLLEWESALSNVLFVTPNAKKYAEKAKSLLTQAGLANSMHKKAAELSGGMKRRVALCRALIANYDLLILDEPFKGLDEETKPGIIQMVQQHALSTGDKILLCITHDPGEADALGGQRIHL
ncbi:MAG: ATP-binding cassette domain-containing protein [Defluviitaleaceae bacterium]|nr:ATP-binding cassette domain-containing protein [Defluviitaleaceae bacterium]MCL2239537.1 ATP-binding cassette domain-containing protein [Defluviitaleaceae bacterium]